ncbi:hypothetical protein, partial [Streptomyces sp. P17]
IRYLTEEKDGVYTGKSMDRWKLKGLDIDPQTRDIIKSLINSHKIDVPSSKDGRNTNIAAINVKGLRFNTKEEKAEALAARKAQFATATDYEKENLEREIVIINAMN